MPGRTQVVTMRWVRAAIRSWVRPGRAREINTISPYGSVMTSRFTAWRRVPE